jgi:hypothetical protein
MATEHLSEMLKHLPPSGVSLRLVDVSSSSMLQDIQQLRPDVEPIASLDTLADLADNSVDAVIGFHPDIEGHALPDFLPVGD